jgi:hypothetical protein
MTPEQRDSVVAELNDKLVSGVITQGQYDLVFREVETNVDKPKA